jgi:hypothetical protein
MFGLLNSLVAENVQKTGKRLFAGTARNKKSLVNFAFTRLYVNGRSGT